ncbi:hypothetical protein H4582DRAFT_2064952 [Lactarius indigo]|nr:hypothetical protein H4582DRAFT_2064952 [Lactarius indigo]
MFSDPVDSSSSDAMSFDEDDMYGSDSNAKTINLKPDSIEPHSPAHVDHASLPNDHMEHADLILETEEMCMDLKDISLMVRALCETVGINMSQTTSETQDGQYQGHSPHASEMASGSEGVDNGSGSFGAPEMT